MARFLNLPFTSEEIDSILNSEGAEIVYAAYLEEVSDRNEYKQDTARLLIWIIDLLSYFSESVIRSLGGKIRGRLKQLLAPPKWQPEHMRKGPLSDEELVNMIDKKKPGD